MLHSDFKLAPELSDAKASYASHYRINLEKDRRRIQNLAADKILMLMKLK
jgi:hypothetical protein